MCLDGERAGRLRHRGLRGDVLIGGQPRHHPLPHTRSNQVRRGNPPQRTRPPSGASDARPPGPVTRLNTLRDFDESLYRPPDCGPVMAAGNHRWIKGGSTCQSQSFTGRSTRTRWVRPCAGWSPSKRPSRLIAWMTIRARTGPAPGSSALRIPMRMASSASSSHRLSRRLRPVTGPRSSGFGSMATTTGAGAVGRPASRQSSSFANSQVTRRGLGLGRRLRWHPSRAAASCMAI